AVSRRTCPTLFPGRRFPGAAGRLSRLAALASARRRNLPVLFAPGRSGRRRSRGENGLDAGKALFRLARRRPARRDHPTDIVESGGTLGGVFRQHCRNRRDGASLVEAQQEILPPRQFLEFGQAHAAALRVVVADLAQHREAALIRFRLLPAEADIEKRADGRLAQPALLDLGLELRPAPGDDGLARHVAADALA